LERETRVELATLCLGSINHANLLRPIVCVCAVDGISPCVSLTVAI
jgi:hypothetical protein